jgi:two-component system sensor histidine kinase CpxA
LVLVVAILLTLTSRPSADVALLESQQSKLLNDAVQAYQTGGEDGLWRYFRGIHDSHNVRLHLFGQDGQTLLGGRRLPPPILEAAEGKGYPADTLLGRIRPFQFLRETETGPDGRRYTLIIELPERHGWFGPHGVPGLGLLIAILSSGLVCYILARYLTSPVVRLRAATQKLASGDLSARAGMPSPRRRDEIAELVRDFDRMAERIENLVHAQNRLLTDISHELRSPLARLSVALELARQRSGPDAGSALDRIDRETVRLNELIQRLLTIARLEGSDETMERSQVDLEELIREIAKDAAFETQCRNCQVEVSVQNRCEVIGSPSLLHSAIENVVRNAIRYSQDGTVVEVRLEQDFGPGGAQAVVRVIDSGPGVPEDSLAKLFQPFYRIDDARGRQTGGVGLGLAITQRAVRLHGGTVQASNRPEGGLMVEIRLPIETSGSRPVSPIPVASVTSRDR